MASLITDETTGLTTTGVRLEAAGTSTGDTVAEPRSRFDRIVPQHRTNDDPPAALANVAEDDTTRRNAEWFSQIAAVKKSLEEMNRLMSADTAHTVESDMSLKDLYAQLKMVRKRTFDNAKKKMVNDVIEVRLEQIQGIAKMAKGKLEAMRDSIAELKKQIEKAFGNQYTGCEIKMRQTMHASLCKRLHKLVYRFRELQLEAKENLKNGLRTQVQLLLDDDETPENVEKLVDQCVADGVAPFQAAMVNGKSWQQARNTLDDVMEKHKDIVKLEASITELAEMFNDLAVLISSQGEILDRIEQNVSNTKSYATKGMQEMQKATILQSQNRKKLCCLLWLGGCILLFILGPLIPWLVLTNA